MSQPMKGITCCADCAYYNMKKHHCTRASDEGKPTDHFYADCPLPTVTTEPGWISVEERLPEDLVTVLAVKQLKNGRINICLARCIREYTFFDYTVGREVTEPRWVCGGNNNILYWMPLPDLPKEG